MVRTGLTVEERERVWQLRVTGLSLRAVARAAGLQSRQVARFVAAAGGVRLVSRRRAAWCLTAIEREEISRGVAAGLSCRRIAVGLARSPSTVSREIARNGGRQRCRAGVAEAAGWERPRRPKAAKLAADAVLRAVVEQCLSSGAGRRRHP